MLNIWTGRASSVDLEQFDNQTDLAKIQKQSGSTLFAIPLSILNKCIKSKI